MSTKGSLYGNEKGIALILVLMFVGAVALLGTVAVLMTSTDIKISGNYKASKKALYVAEAGAQEAKARLRGNADSSSIEITYADPTNDPIDPDWETYIGTDTLAQKLPDYATGDPITPSIHTFSDMDYAVQIMHAVDPETGNVLYWGDDDNDGEWTRNTTTGENIYLIRSYGIAEGSTKTVQLEVTRLPPITVKAALYAGASTSIKGNVAINGNDSCGDGSDNKPGIATKKLSSSSPVEIRGGATVEGEGDPSVSYDETMAVQSMADFLKKSADFSYNVTTYTTYTASATPGPGDGWGVPDLTVNPSADPPTPNCDSYNLVHYDADGTSTIKLSGQVSGCGILVVEGDLEITGGFEWYGTVIVTGALRFSGGGAGNNIMGAVITGGTADGDVLTGNVKINYCSTATEDENEKHSLLILSWKEVLAE